MPSLDVQFVRNCFPAFQQPLPAKTAFFENAGGSYVAAAVIDRYLHFYQANKVQPYGASAICRAAGVQMDAGRQAIAELLGVAENSITLGPSTTQNFNTLAIACAAIVDDASTIIVTEQDHEANIGAWQRLCQRTGAKLKHWQIDANGELAFQALEAMLDDSVKLICMTHSSNIIGTVNPVEQVIKMARPHAIRVVIDGVSLAPHRWPTIPACKPDAYCFSTYKTYATHLGVMYLAADFAAALGPQCHYFNLGYPHKRFDSAGPDHASIAALAGLGAYFTASHQHHFGASDLSLYQRAQQISALMHAHENQLCQRFLDGIASLPLNILGRNSMPGREANIALYSGQFSSAQMSQALGNADIAAGHGHFYAKRLLEKAGIKNSEDGVLRVSFSHYNTAQEVDRVIAALAGLH